MTTFDERLDPQLLAYLQNPPAEGTVEPARYPTVVHEDRTIPGPEGAPDVLVRVYQPAERGDDAAPAVLWIHGGGFAGGTYDEFPGIYVPIVLEAGAVVVSVDYRLAPDHPFPAAPNDCYAALAWLAAASDELHIDWDRIAIGGASAGGCIAAAVALIARDNGGPHLCYQWLLIPATDDRMETPSSQGITDPRVFNSEGVREIWETYLGDSYGSDDVSPYAAPARAADLSGLPPTYVLVEDLDPLRDEGIAYANRLMQVGVKTELHKFPGTFHGSFVFAPKAGVSQHAHTLNLAAITRALTI